MPRLQSTRTRDVNIHKKTHPAGFDKVRCRGCGIGMATLTQIGKQKVYQCARCGRSYGVADF